MKWISLVSVFFIALAANAQKYGHCNAAEIAQMLPEIAEAEKQFEAKTQELDGRLQRMFELYQEKVSEFQTNAPNLTEQQQAEAAQEIQNLEARIGEAQQNSQLELQEFDAALKEPIIQKVRAAIKQVSIDHQFTLIFDLSTGAVLYANGEDITELVKTQLGI
jgi:outer membrane protein